MKMTILLVTVAMILIFAICLGRDVKFSINVWGTRASLEVSDQHAGHTQTVGQGHATAATRTEGDATNASPQSKQ